jgi:hypothetical protein
MACAVCHRLLQQFGRWGIVFGYLDNGLPRLFQPFQDRRQAGVQRVDARCVAGDQRVEPLV